MSYNGDNIERGKIQERVKYTEQEKIDIWNKTGGKCAHCGNELFIVPYGKTKDENLFTVDHFVPLSRGGFNRIHNLIPLCKNCNDNKTNDVRHPDEYLKFVEDSYKSELEGLYESYLMSFEYVNRNNLLANDVYVYTAPQNLNKQFMFNQSARSRRRNGGMAGSNKEFSYEVRKAHYDDLDDIYAYYVKYLKKYDYLEDDNAAKMNIAYWFTYGVLYYIRGKDNSIQCFTAVIPDTKNVRMLIHPFFYYNKNMKHWIIAYSMLNQLSIQIMDEQGLPYIPIDIMTIKPDDIVLKTPFGHALKDHPYDPRFNVSCMDIINSDIPGLKGLSSKSTEEVDKYMEEHGHTKEVEDFFEKIKTSKYEIASYLGDNEGRIV